MTYKVTGYIIGKKDFRDTDRLYTLYTAEQGKIQAMAQGVKKISSKLSGHLELFHKAAFTIAKGKHTNRITTVDTIHRSEHIKYTFEKCIAASYCLEITNQLVKWNECDKELYTLIEDFFSYLESVPATKAALLSKFYIVQFSRILGYAHEGYCPDFSSIHTPLRRTVLGSLEQACDGFLHQHLERPLLSEKFFKLFISAIKKTAMNAV